MNPYDVIVITSAAISRKLLRMGNPILDIKPNRENNRETVFVFRKEQKLLNDLEEIRNQQPK